MANVFYRFLILGEPLSKEDKRGLPQVCEKYLKRATGGGGQPVDMKACELILKIAWDMTGKGEIGAAGGEAGKSLMEEAREAAEREREAALVATAPSGESDAEPDADASPNGSVPDDQPTES